MFSQVTETPRFAELANLSIDRLKQLETTLASILASPNAQDTYAQIIDGRATWQSHVDPNTRGFPNETIIVSDHPTPSDGAMQLYEEIRTVFTPQALKIDVQVCPTSHLTGVYAGADSGIASPELPKCTAG